MTGVEFTETMKVLFREAWFQDALLFVEGLDAIRSVPGHPELEGLLDELAQTGGVTIMAGTKPWSASTRRALDVVIVSFPLPDFEARRNEWLANLEGRGLSVSASALDALADRFRLSTVQIADAVSSACNRAHLRAGSQAAMSIPVTSAAAAERVHATASPTVEDLFAGARAQSGDSLAALACRVEPRYTWKDLVLPSDALTQLHEICQRVAHRQRVLGAWGFDRKLALGKGVNALFAGPPGTGKTMAAEVIASELRLDLYRIDLAGVVSKYIGETEKNLDRVFSAAEGANAILFFDEADALFGKRSEVRDSHDRYANLEISYLLQKMEQHEGVAILATNLRQNLDDAFMRRVAFTVHFPFPDESSRRLIWEQIWPPETPLAEDVDFDWMARQFRMSGGNIKNIALAGAFLAAEDGGRVTMGHLRQATWREHQKMGKTALEPETHAFDWQGRIVATPVPVSGSVTGAS
jgi:SpoVK/Ycf46/Vps4 family AAA+-type ATPase